MQAGTSLSKFLLPPLAKISFLLLSLIAVPSAVPMMHLVSRTMNSITLSWPQPDQPNGIILDYQLRYFDKVSRVDLDWDGPG